MHDHKPLPDLGAVSIFRRPFIRRIHDAKDKEVSVVRLEYYQDDFHPYEGRNYPARIETTIHTVALLGEDGKLYKLVDGDIASPNVRVAEVMTDEDLLAKRHPDFRGSVPGYTDYVAIDHLLTGIIDRQPIPWLRIE